MTAPKDKSWCEGATHKECKVTFPHLGCTHLDEFVLLTPSFDVEHQIQFVALTDGERVPFTSIAILRNR